MQRLDSFCASVLWFEFHNLEAEGNWRGRLLSGLSNYSVFAEANIIVPQVGWIPRWESEARKYSQQVLAKCVNKTKWKISFPQESAVVVRSCCYFVLSTDGVMNLTLMDFLGLWYFHAPLPDNKITFSFFKMLWTFILLIYWGIYIPTCQAALAWYCLAPLKCYFLRTASEGNSYFCPVLPVTGLCCVASATFPLGQMDNISDAQYDCVPLVQKAIANRNPKDE